MKAKNKRKKLAARVSDFQKLKQKYPGMYRQPGSSRK